jgi:RHS repeat-associated protein
MLAEYSTIVEPQSTAKVSYLTTDHLGSPRILTDANGNVISRRDFHPFGEEIITAQRTQGSGYTADSVRQKFTGYERDIESDLDYAQARYYNSKHGRFTSVDPIIMKLDRMADPQRINLYSYVRNTPLMFIDPKGTDLVLGQGDQKRIRKALVEIAKRKEGREFLQKLDKLTIQIILQTGDVNGRDYERIGGKDSKNPTFVRVKDDKGNITDVKGDAISLTIDTKVLDKDRKENEKRKAVNEGLESLGLPAKPLIPNVPSSDALVVGHGLAHGESQFFGLPNDEDTADERINNILNQPVDKNLAKDAEKFVDDLLKPNQPVEQPVDEKKKKP